MFRLAMDLGMSVEELGRRISSRELVEWMIMVKSEKLGTERGDLQAGIIAATVANATPRRNGRAFMPADFMPTSANDTVDPDPDQVQAKAAAQHIAKLFGGA